MAEYDLAGLGNVLVELHRPGRFANQFSQRTFALLEWCAGQVLSAQLEQIEGVRVRVCAASS
jgi:hypothetical protein